jgi:hypothetical protein
MKALPEVRERVLALLRMRGSATQKQILNSVGRNHREKRDQCIDAIRELLDEHLIETITVKVTRYAIVRRQP